MAKLMTVLIVLERLQRGRITYETRYPVSEYAWREHGAHVGRLAHVPADQFRPSACAT